ncbi:hypothetical protein BWZ20_08175 [Winogradskyella sp. J14-2]|uniref:hypothetical protein n=1 Tax=Winogradskyella sp. J14-2 TaxID=1936080 RepID=UPI0009729075|nr:hypothetical protein [Winogradskyella sp. J14-2]APY08276.1 hypothetical protein BWZ20_08175 [Winogradskyella sp. J14-2]
MLYLYIAQPMILKKAIALSFVVLFTMIISAPTIILSFDDSADVSAFFGMSEEEEEQEDIKLLLDYSLEMSEDATKEVAIPVDTRYTANIYRRPHLNLISPPPERPLV